MGHRRFVLVALVAVAAPAVAEVVKVSPVGFETRHSITIAAPPGRVWAALIALPRWWSGEHTYSGKAANLSLDPRAGGCWCESTGDGGSIEHMRVVYAQPRKLLRMTGGLGPLQAEGVTGALTVTLAPTGDNATLVTFSYVVGGYVRDGADRLAGPVDTVIGLQVARLSAAATRP